MANLNIPPSCSLDGRQFQQRKEAIQGINAQWLRTESFSSRSLVLIYDVAAHGVLQELVEKERVCCATLDFQLIAARDKSTLIITVPTTEGDPQAALAPFRAAGNAVDTCCTTCTPNDIAPTSRTTPVAGTALAAGSAALLGCAACCVLPIVVPAIAMGAAGSVLSWFAVSHAWLTQAATVLVVMGWGWIAIDAVTGHRRPTPLTWVLMASASTICLFTLVWPAIEPTLILHAQSR